MASVYLYQETGGTSTAFTLTTTGSGSLVTGEYFVVSFHTTSGTNPTLNRDAQGAKSLKYYDSSGSKVACGSSTILSGMKSGVLYDGTDYVVMNPLGIGGLTNSLASITTSNITGVASTRHVLDVAGMTANRNFVLPAGTAGQEVEVNISVGDDTYALILIGDTGISINGGSAATEWNRLFNTGESVKFVATSTTNWNVISDGRIPCVAVLQRQAAQSINDITATKIAFDAAPVNRGSMGDIATNDRVNIRRANIYSISGFVSIGNVLDDQEFLEAELYLDGALIKFKRDYVSRATANTFASPESTAVLSLAVGKYIELYIFHNEGASQNTDTTYYPTLSVTEVL